MLAGGSRPQRQYLLDLLAQIPDPRKRHGRRHALAALLAIGTAAVTGGSKSFAAIGQCAGDSGGDVLAGLGAVREPAQALVTGSPGRWGTTDSASYCQSV